MGQKDITEKLLADYNDVFADIINVLLFDGKTYVKQEELRDTRQRSQYKAGNAVHEQERDISKLWIREHVRFCFYGLENQTKVDADIPLRIISYDGAAYRAQLLKQSDGNYIKERYPVITVVLYFGMEPWNKAVNLHGCLKIPEKLKRYVNDYKANVIEVAYLSEEQVSKFTSDFKIVADYFVQMRKNKDYHPSKETIQHVDEVLKLMSVLTGDERFLEAQSSGGTGGIKNMCEAFDRAEERGIKKGIEQGIKKGCMRGEYIKLISLIRKKVAKNLTAEECADLLEEKLELIQSIYQLMEAYPDKTDEQIYAEYEKTKTI